MLFWVGCLLVLLIDVFGDVGFVVDYVVRLVGFGFCVVVGVG